MRVAVTVCAVAAILALSTLPVEHLHRSDSAKAIVHRHAMDDVPERLGVTLDHSDHHSARTLEPAFVSQRQYDLDRTLVTAARVFMAFDRRVAGPLKPFDARKAHGPPVSSASLRAPPA